MLLHSLVSPHRGRDVCVQASSNRLDGDLCSPIGVRAEIRDGSVNAVHGESKMASPLGTRSHIAATNLNYRECKPVKLPMSGVLRGEKKEEARRSRLVPAKSQN